MQVYCSPQKIPFFHEFKRASYPLLTLGAPPPSIMTIENVQKLPFY